MLPQKQCLVKVQVICVFVFVTSHWHVDVTSALVFAIQVHAILALLFNESPFLVAVAALSFSHLLYVEQNHLSVIMCAVYPDLADMNMLHGIPVILEIVVLVVC